jgi:CBS domain-containing protein
MTKTVFTAEASLGLLESLQLMVDKGIGCVVVTKNGEPVGMLTERDVLKRIVQDRGVLANKLEEMMSQPLTVVPPETPVLDALNLMKEKGIRRLPVVSQGKLEGIITIHSDLLYWFTRAGGTTQPVS